MFEQLCREKNRAIALAQVLAAVAVLMVIVIFSQAIKVRRLQVAELSYIKILNAKREDINLICQVNGNLNTILRMEIPKMKLAWDKDVLEVCR